jgi:hypothetical protein
MTIITNTEGEPLCGLSTVDGRQSGPSGNVALPELLLRFTTQALVLQKSVIRDPAITLSRWQAGWAADLEPQAAEVERWGNSLGIFDLRSESSWCSSPSRRSCSTGELRSESGPN